MAALWRKKFVTYSGMTIPHDEGSYTQMYDKCRASVARRRERQPVTLIKREPGRVEWECETPETAMMISDLDGYLILERVGA